MYYVYILRCRRGTLYTGMTPDLPRRMAAHVGGTGAKYTRSHPPEELAAVWAAEGKTAAARLEYAVKKHLTRPQKLTLIAAPEHLGDLLPGLTAGDYTHVPGVTLEGCLSMAGRGRRSAPAGQYTGEKRDPAAN